MEDLRGLLVIAGFSSFVPGVLPSVWPARIGNEPWLLSIKSGRAKGGFNPLL